MKRQLAAIFYADVAGYSRLTRLDEELWENAGVRVTDPPRNVSTSKTPRTTG